MPNPTTGPPSAVLRLADKLERDGARLEAQAIRLVSRLYRNLSLADLVALINAVSGGPSVAARVAGLDMLMDAFKRATAELGTTPTALNLFLSAAVQTGSSTGAAMIAAAVGNPELIDAFRLRPDREIELAQHAYKRLEVYWGRENQRLISEVQSALLEGLERGQSPAQMAARLRERVSVSKSRALLIATNEISNVMAAGAEASQRDAGITEYIWRTARDKRVRPEHQARDGKRFRWDDPPSDGHPGQAIRCRCVAVAVIPKDFT